MSRVDWARDGRDWPNRSASQFVDVGTVRWHVQRAGTGPALLLLHGTGAATHSWRDLLPMLASDFTVVAPDLPGHGFSAISSARNLSLLAMSAAIADLLDHLGIAPQLVVGHSAGAAIAATLVGQKRCQPAALIALNGALLPFPGLAARLFPAMAQMLFINPLVPRLFAMQARIPGEVGRFLARSTGSRIDAAGVGCYERLMRTSDHCAAALGMMAQWDLEPVKRSLPALPCPLHLVHGEKDTAIPVSVSRAVARLVPCAEISLLPGLGHLAHEEAPQQVADIIRRLA